MLKKIPPVLLLLSFAFSSILAQRAQPREADVLFRTHIVRAVDLKWQSSKEIFGQDIIFPVILYDAVLRGELTAYKDATFKEKISVEDLLQKLCTTDGDSSYPVLKPEQMTEIELGEDLVFDSKRSEHYFLPQSLALFIPVGLNPHGLKEPWAVFHFEDCQKIFRADPRAYSEDKLISGRKVSFADLLVLKCFYNEIVKIGHAGDSYFDQKYQDRVEAFIHSKDAQDGLIDFLYGLYNPE